MSFDSRPGPKFDNAYLYDYQFVAQGGQGRGEAHSSRAERQEGRPEDAGASAPGLPFRRHPARPGPGARRAVRGILLLSSPRPRQGGRNGRLDPRGQAPAGRDLSLPRGQDLAQGGRCERAPDRVGPDDLRQLREHPGPRGRLQGRPRGPVLYGVRRRQERPPLSQPRRHRGGLPGRRREALRPVADERRLQGPQVLHGRDPIGFQKIGSTAFCSTWPACTRKRRRAG
ncbi:MAG: hypothetical protein MZV64_11390 [Ignavibacteriales bacterium]|nr:hypothetical protein [Ignavibacteriales bacterium]